MIASAGDVAPVDVWTWWVPFAAGGLTVGTLVAVVAWRRELGGWWDRVCDRWPQPEPPPPPPRLRAVRMVARPYDAERDG